VSSGILCERYAELKPIPWHKFEKRSANIYARAATYLFAAVLIFLSAFPQPVQSKEFGPDCSIQQNLAPHSEGAATTTQKIHGKQSESEQHGFDSFGIFLQSEFLGADLFRFPSQYTAVHYALQEHTQLCPRAPPV